MNNKTIDWLLSIKEAFDKNNSPVNDRNLLVPLNVAEQIKESFDNYEGLINDSGASFKKLEKNFDGCIGQFYGITIYVMEGLEKNKCLAGNGISNMVEIFLND